MNEKKVNYSIEGNTTLVLDRIHDLECSDTMVIIERSKYDAAMQESKFKAFIIGSLLGIVFGISIGLFAL